MVLAGRYIEGTIKAELEGLGEVDAAAAAVVRVVSSHDESTAVKTNVRDGYSRPATGRYADEYTFRSKAIFLFQRLDGIDVLLFVMYVQEYGVDSPAPNTRQVYIAYLDSVQYFRPRRLRTTVYQSLIASYMEYVRRRGFTGAHIWACPPVRSGSYIFPSRPVEQQVPTGQRLRAWYQQMLHVCHRQDTVVGSTTMYDRYFGDMGDLTGNRRKPKAKVSKTGQRKTAGTQNRNDPVQEFRWSHGLPPYFEGDWWTLQAETVVKSARWQQPKRLLRQLMEHNLNRQGLFSAAVDPIAMEIPEYLQIIKQPMDLNTVKMKLDHGQYKKPLDFVADVRLVFTNAMAFNSAGHHVHSVARQLLSFFDERLMKPLAAAATTRGGRPPARNGTALAPSEPGTPPGDPSSKGGGKKAAKAGGKGAKGAKGIGNGLMGKNGSRKRKDVPFAPAPVRKPRPSTACAAVPMAALLSPCGVCVFEGRAARRERQGCGGSAADGHAAGGLAQPAAEHGDVSAGHQGRAHRGVYALALQRLPQPNHRGDGHGRTDSGTDCG